MTKTLILIFPDFQGHLDDLRPGSKHNCNHCRSSLVGSPLLCLSGSLSSHWAPLHQLHERVEDDPHGREQQPQDQHRKPPGEDDVVELGSPIILGEGVDLRTDPKAGEEQTGDPEEDQRPAETD